MATREEIAAEIGAIDKRLTAGTERVAYQGESVWFNFDILQKRKRELQAQLAALDGKPRLRRALTYSTKGL